MSPRQLSRAAIVALGLALPPSGCQKSGVACTPPPVVACPAGGGPDFQTDVLPIFQQVCDNCHAPDAPMPQTPYFTNYKQIYGTSGGSEVGTINVWVFDMCEMPPANAPVPLSDDQRQTLLVWLACGAPDSPAADAGARD